MLPSNTTLSDIKSLPIYTKEIDPFCGEWLTRMRDNTKTYYHTSSREELLTAPMMAEPEVIEVPIPSIAAGLGGTKDDSVVAQIHENFVVFEHPLFPAAKGWRIAKT